jgi:very-short-patch-repair endonuclease
MNLFANTVLQLINTSQHDSTKDNIDDKIFKLRKEMRVQRRENERKYDPKNITDSENNIYYTYENKGKREAHVRRILQSIFQKPFASCRPAWLKNPHTKRKLEIDCYNAELRIAVEIDGEQHSKYLPHFHKTHSNFLKQQERDLMKSKMIVERGIRLVRVPYTISSNELEKFLMSELNKII